MRIKHVFFEQSHDEAIKPICILSVFCLKYVLKIIRERFILLAEVISETHVELRFIRLLCVFFGIPHRIRQSLKDDYFKEIDDLAEEIAIKTLLGLYKRNCNFTHYASTLLFFIDL